MTNTITVENPCSADAISGPVFDDVELFLGTVREVEIAMVSEISVCRDLLEYELTYTSLDLE